MALVAASRNEVTLFGDTPSKLINNPSTAPNPSVVRFMQLLRRVTRAHDPRQAQCNYALFHKVLEAIPQLVQITCKFTDFDFGTS